MLKAAYYRLMQNYFVCPRLDLLSQAWNKRPLSFLLYSPGLSVVAHQQVSAKF
jgi:hypothetical protein